MSFFLLSFFFFFFLENLFALFLYRFCISSNCVFTIPICGIYSFLCKEELCCCYCCGGDAGKGLILRKPALKMLTLFPRLSGGSRVSFLFRDFLFNTCIVSFYCKVGAVLCDQYLINVIFKVRFEES